ncbi:MAG: hypothetical protein ORN51_06575 [Akkermansiaceae bacterium]|nr:hypothetical protein [Akkermansiaceae bacterium]
MLRPLIISLCFTLGSGIQAAEETAPKGINVRFFAAALNEGQGPVCVVSGKTKGASFDIPMTSLSEAQGVSSRDFILAVAAPESPDKPPVPLVTLHLPDQGSDFRILLVPAPNSTYKAVVIRGDDSKFRHGDFFFINLSNQPILGALGSTRVDLKLGAQELVRPTGAKSETFFVVKFARREGEMVVPMSDTCWPIVKDNRSYVLFYNGKNGRPAFRAVDEFMAIEAPAP